MRWCTKLYIDGLVFLVTQHVIGLMSLGPCTALVIRTSLSSRSNGIHTVFGAVVGSFLIKTLSVLGLACILIHYPTLFNCFKIAGATYLVWLGLMCYFNAYKTFIMPKDVVISVGNDESFKRSPFWAGFWISMTNPLSSVRFIAIFSTVITPKMPLPTQLSYLVILAAISLAFYMCVSLFFSTTKIQNIITRYRHILDIILGSTLAYWGLKIFKATIN